MATVDSGSPRRPRSPGEISPDRLYRRDEVQERMGWAAAAFRAACRRGLKVHRAGKRLYCLGSDVIAYATTSNSEEAANG
jgi:hypothetical protein